MYEKNIGREIEPSLGKIYCFRDSTVRDNDIQIINDSFSSFTKIFNLETTPLEDEGTALVDRRLQELKYMPNGGVDVNNFFKNQLLKESKNSEDRHLEVIITNEELCLGRNRVLLGMTSKFVGSIISLKYFTHGHINSAFQNDSRKKQRVETLKNNFENYIGFLNEFRKRMIERVIFHEMIHIFGLPVRPNGTYESEGLHCNNMECCMRQVDNANEAIDNLLFHSFGDDGSSSSICKDCFSEFKTIYS